MSFFLDIFKFGMLDVYDFLSVCFFQSLIGLFLVFYGDI